MSIVWPALYVIDLTHNKLNDLEEIFELLNGFALRKDIIKIVAIKGNQFYNYGSTNSFID